ncbi:hypothetical protein [Mesorhizobium denitrificans]|uniref:Uncharacterized protein n=1 Tax=Mesorhizobium denitrificans TaxID=2294114 RepID=A0A371X6A3_9HYPH|nr:hypothetical protein [Mesorhizobium denitrificans]RFC64755.1 hypothetical protein DY251_18485 [Mesorhizobium denitrificans]
MTALQTKITTYPPLPTADITALERLILTKVLDSAVTEDGLKLYTDTGPMNPVAVTRRELSQAVNRSDASIGSLLRDFLERDVLRISAEIGLDPETVIFIDLGEFPWQFIVQDILTRLSTACEFVVIQWISDRSQRPDSFGASVSLITENGIFHTTSHDLLADFRRRDRVLAGETSNAHNANPTPLAEIDDDSVIVPRKIVIIHPQMGVYLGHCLGLGFWTLLDPAGQSEAVVFDSVADARAHIASWENENRPDDYGFHEVAATGRYATIPMLIEAGLSHLLGTMAGTSPDLTGSS